jgi:hypothetical protein
MAMPSLTAVVFTDLGDGRTEMRVEQRGTHSRDLYERSLEGWASFFARLASACPTHERAAAETSTPV